jgi:hypothetical protein
MIRTLGHNDSGTASHFRAAKINIYKTLTLPAL